MNRKKQWKRLRIFLNREKRIHYLIFFIQWHLPGNSKSRYAITGTFRPTQWHDESCHRTNGSQLVGRRTKVGPGVLSLRLCDGEYTTLLIAAACWKRYTISRPSNDRRRHTEGGTLQSYGRTRCGEHSLRNFGEHGRNCWPIRDEKEAMPSKGGKRISDVDIKKGENHLSNIYWAYIARSLSLLAGLPGRVGRACHKNGPVAWSHFPRLNFPRRKIRLIFVISDNLCFGHRKFDPSLTAVCAVLGVIMWDRIV